MPSGRLVYAAERDVLDGDRPVGRAAPPRSLPFSSSMSASAASSRCAAIFFALSASLRATTAVAAPPTGVERDA